eukprot:56939-Rhodomonas_salina.3
MACVGGLGWVLTRDCVALAWQRSICRANNGILGMDALGACSADTSSDPHCARFRCTQLRRVAHPLYACCFIPLHSLSHIFT